jgi:hypothetical protein
MRRLVAFFCVVLLSACTSLAVHEFEIYKTAFDKTNEASASILDQLALQERALFLRRYKYARSGTHFDPTLAPFFSESVDPPGTAAFRGALEVVKAYNEIMYGLETGQTAQSLAAKLQAMETATSNSVTAAAGAIAVGAPGASGGMIAAMTGLNEVFSALLPFIQLGLKYRAQQEFRIFLVQHYGVVREILFRMRAGTSVIFPVLTAASV